MIVNTFDDQTEAYRDEGFSYHYVPASDYSTIKNASIVAKAFIVVKEMY
ncbi:nucleoside phosphorylase [Clostridium sp. HBUAS56017]|nr:nucleoside phosphorylase [Clostridium sp. HBUAS56017]